MASTDTPLAVAEKSLLERGFYCWEDISAGNRVSELASRGFPYFTEYGLDFCADFAFDSRIQSILEASFARCVLGHWLRYEEYPDHVECWRRGGRNAGRRVFMVHVWSKGARVDYYVGSHLHALDTTKGLRSVYEIPSSELNRVGCEPETKEFVDGGIVILDARLCFEIKQGYAITFMFATEDVVAKWAKIVLPHSTTLADKVAQMEKKSTKIGLNFTFQAGNTRKEKEIS
ncbi:hypothetical protein B0J13DRAFT_582863 [Dactylonectria estremocensis]|uniref:Uncharacterized protein n=1 Tax=Dactylonectria estremocensis TaxID=1079267 RepID=A0A9P9J768_9HYPO|nr:hypothetical protein B0J13DRAFT_582863 [Dactylonectria estremocensis]